MSIKHRLKQLENRQPSRYISLWDVLFGAVEMPQDLSLIDPRHLPLLEALMKPLEDPPDRIELELEKARAQLLAQDPGTNGNLASGVNSEGADQGQSRGRAGHAP
jgi:hypothetical protein